LLKTDLERLPPALTREIQKLPSRRLRQKVIREVLTRNLSVVQIRQLVNGLLKLKDFPSGG